LVQTFKQIVRVVFAAGIVAGFMHAAELWAQPMEDGFKGAPTGAAQHPQLLEGLVRPPWKVAGVDYAVGVPPTVKLKVPTSENLPQGASRRSEAIYVTGANVTLDGFDFSGLTVMIDGAASGVVTITHCKADGIVIRSTVDASAELVVSYCTLDGRGMAGDPNFQTIKVWCPLTVKYVWIKNSTGGIQSGTSLTALYNLLEGFAWAPGLHANAIYIRGTDRTADKTLIAYNTMYSQSSRNDAGFPVGIGAAIAFFGDGGSFYDSTISNNVLISAMPGAASYLIGFYVPDGASAMKGTVRDNYLASVNGFNRAKSGAFGAFYPGSQGFVQTEYVGNVDMSDGRRILAGPTRGRPVKRD
jgi:hypothetical protein